MDISDNNLQDKTITEEENRYIESEISSIKSLDMERATVAVISAAVFIFLNVIALKDGHSLSAMDTILTFMFLALIVAIAAVIIILSLTRQKNRKMYDLGLTKEQVSNSNIEASTASQLAFYGTFVPVLVVLGVYLLPAVYSLIFFALALLSAIMFVWIIIRKWRKTDERR